MSEQNQAARATTDLSGLDVIGLVEAAQGLDYTVEGLDVDDREAVLEFDVIRDLRNLVLETTADRWIYRSAT